MRPIVQSPGARRAGLRRLLVLLGLAAGGGGLIAVLALAAPHVLVRQDAFDYADTAVVLAGEPFRRLLGARDLYLAGRVGRILVSPEPVDPTIAAELRALGVPDQNQTAAQVLQASGIPAAAVDFLPAPSDSTLMEAQRVRVYFGTPPPPRLVVVTGGLSTGRACYIFAQVLTQTQVICQSSRYDRYATAQWWAQRTYSPTIGLEYLKWLVAVVQLQVLGHGSATPPAPLAAGLPPHPLADSPSSMRLGT
jgi:uncharacterized SAM-binding protein YcdF (DUF218 family)